MVLAVFFGLALVQLDKAKPAGDWYLGLEVVDSSLRCDWARRYVSIDAGGQSAIRLTGSGRHYTVRGFFVSTDKPAEFVEGTFTQAHGQLRGRIQLRDGARNWKGEWNRRRGCFQLVGKSKPEHIDLWQELPPLHLGFVLGQAPLAKPQDVPDNLMGTEMDTQALYGFPASFPAVVQLADRELLAKHWRKTHWRPWYEKSERVFACYYEGGPTGRSVVIEPDSSVPESNAASDLIVAGTRRKDWVGVCLNGPKIHG